MHAQPTTKEHKDTYAHANIILKKPSKERCHKMSAQLLPIAEVMAAAATTAAAAAAAKRRNINDAAAAAKGQPKRRRNERNILTFYEKIAVIRYYEDTNISRNSLAKMFHCCATQIRRILDRKADLLQQLATLSEADASIIIEEMTRKRRKFEMSAISFILHQWVERCRQLRLRLCITNQTLKETALKMAAVLNLPTFRPSYRWLNRFRDKYRYNDEDLGLSGPHTVEGHLSVEDIIIEFKDALPSFMQKEITSITANEKDSGGVKAQQEQKTPPPLAPIVMSHENSIDCESSVDEEDDDSDDDVIEVTPDLPIKEIPNEVMPAEIAADSSGGEEPQPNDERAEFQEMNAGTCTLLNSVFPHLAVIHQFALMNSDVKALELISQLGVHMQTQAVSGAYKQLSLATAQQLPTMQDDCMPLMGGGIYADIDDIELIE